jgi:uncharacterized membrane protein YbhN (UPF0104 family)
LDHVDLTPEAAPPNEPTPRPRAESRHLHIRIFSSASDAPRARRPTDAVLLVASGIGVLLCLFPAPDLTNFDTAVTDLFQSLPRLAGGVWEIAFDVLGMWSTVLLLSTVLAHDRLRVLRDMLLALGIAFVYTWWAAGQTGTDVWTSLQGVASGDSSAYLATRLAVATALIATASPHMSHPLRRVGRWIIVVGAAASIALGVSATLGTLMGFLIGIGGAASVHLLFGSPGGRLTLEDVSQVLSELGIHAIDLRFAPLEPRGVAIVSGGTPEGRPLLIKIFGRDARQGQLIASTWEAIRRRGQTPHVGSGVQQVQHEAFVNLFVERGGVPVMPMLASGVAPEGDAVLVLDADGRPIVSLAAAEIDDGVIENLWRAFIRLDDLGVTMGRVDGHALFVRSDGSAAVGEFGDAQVAADRPQIVSDRAQLLATTALAVGCERAVSIAAGTIGNERLEEALPYLQHAVLDPSVWNAVQEQEWDLEDLRLMAEQEIGSAPKELEQLGRVTWGSILKLALIGFVSWALISALADIGIQTLIQEFQVAELTWVLAALILTPLVQFPQAYSTMGATLLPVRFWPVLMLEYGIQFIALAVPSSAARVALEIRFFERVGVPPAGAVSIGVIDSVSTFIIQMLLMIVITLSGLASLHLFDSNSSSGSTPTISWQALTAAVALLVLAFIVAAFVPRFRRVVKRFVGALRDKATDGRDALQVLRHPRKVLRLFGGNLLVQIMMATILGLCLRAFGYSASLAELVLITSFATVFAGFMPVPGGVGVAEAAYTAGLVAIGIPQTVATSTAIMFRLVTFYLPPAWGWFAMRWMKENRYL